MLELQDHHAEHEAVIATMNTDSSYRALWLGVIELALEDAAPLLRRANVTPKSRAIEMRTARTWLLSDGRDFRSVCTLAGLDPSQVRRRAMDVIAHFDASDQRRSRPKREPVPRRVRAIDELFTHEGETRPVHEWLDRVGRKPSTFMNRRRLGWTITDAIFRERPAPIRFKGFNGRKPKLYTHDGLTLTLDQWATETGVKLRTIRLRLKKGWAFENAISPKNHSGGRRERRA
ncbi:MAG TPA: hypothetical protein VIL65_13885 [Beijerinckiaceae bacterium]|jgi:hypothetical protein